MKKKNIYVSIIALIDWQGRVLLSLRPKNKEFSNYWEFPGGKLKKNEGPDEAIIREIKEELSLDISKKSLKPLSFKTHVYDKFNTIIFFYICRSWSGTPVPKEKQKIIWVEIDKLEKYNFLPANNKFITELRNLKKK